MNGYYQINLHTLDKRNQNRNNTLPTRVYDHVDILIKQCTQSIGSVFVQQSDGVILMELRDNGNLYDLNSEDCVGPDDWYCLDVDSSEVGQDSIIPTRWAMMLEYASLQGLVGPNKPIQQLNT